MKKNPSKKEKCRLGNCIPKICLIRSFSLSKEVHQIVNVNKSSRSMKFIGIAGHGIWAQLVHLLLIRTDHMCHNAASNSMEHIQTAIIAHVQAIRSTRKTLNHIADTMLPTLNILHAQLV